MQTYWAISAFTALDEARENLRQREKTTIDQIAAARKNGAYNSTGWNGESAVHSWLLARQDLDAAIWTTLESNWETV